MIRRVVIWLSLLGPPFGFSGDLCASDGAVIRFNAQERVVEVAGLPFDVLARWQQTPPVLPHWQSLFPIYTGDGISSIADKPPVLGEYRIENSIVQFRPRFPFVKGISYNAQFHFRSLQYPIDEPPLHTTFVLRKTIVNATSTVTNIYPSSDELPENLLKFYIHFSTPMSRGQVHKYIHLVDAWGEEVAEPFLQLESELWDSQGMRLTLFFDPGRIKRGLRPHADLGPPLKAGQAYGLVVDRAMQSAEGTPLVAPYQKIFRAIAADRISPDYEQWRVQAPAAQTRDPIVLQLSEPLDHALLNTFFSVYEQQGQPIFGQIAIAREETEWRFTPRDPWSVGAYQIRVYSELEDLAGNQLNRLFDVDLDQASSLPSDRDKYKTLTFAVRTLP